MRPGEGGDAGVWSQGTVAGVDGGCKERKDRHGVSCCRLTRRAEGAGRAQPRRRLQEPV